MNSVDDWIHGGVVGPAGRERRERSGEENGRKRERETQPLSAPPGIVENAQRVLFYLLYLFPGIYSFFIHSVWLSQEL